MPHVEGADLMRDPGERRGDQRAGAPLPVAHRDPRAARRAQRRDERRPALGEVCAEQLDASPRTWPAQRDADLELAAPIVGTLARSGANARLVDQYRFDAAVQRAWTLEGDLLCGTAHQAAQAARRGSRAGLAP